MGWITCYHPLHPSPWELYRSHIRVITTRYLSSFIEKMCSRVKCECAIERSVRCEISAVSTGGVINEWTPITSGSLFTNGYYTPVNLSVIMKPGCVPW